MPAAASLMPVEQFLQTMEEESKGIRKLKPKGDRNRVIQARRQWMKLVADFVDRPEWDLVAEAEAKAVVCEGRAILADSIALGENDESIEGELEYFKREFDAKARVSSFFGFNLHRSYLPGQWKDVARAYRLFAIAERALTWVSAREEMEPEDFRILMLGVAACEANLFRVIDANVVGALDEQQRRMNMRIREMVADKFYVPFWNLDPENRVATDNVLAEAQKLEPQYERCFQAVQRREMREPAQKRLADILSSDELTDSFEADLQAAVAQVLDSGVQASDKTLRLQLMPYRGYLESTAHKPSLRLIEYIRADMTQASTKGKVVVEADEEPSTNADALLRVREALKGKTVLFIGGNKGQLWRKNDYKESLSIKDLVWPDFEEHTRPDSMSAHIASADVVCLLIRFARHSYKGLLDQAKQQGKTCVTMARGLGLNTFIHCYDEQILGRTTNS
jgi:hypothetical protein